MSLTDDFCHKITGRKRTADPATRRLEIIDSAKKLWLETDRKLEDVSRELIAADLGISPSAVSRYYTMKQLRADVLAEVDSAPKLKECATCLKFLPVDMYKGYNSCSVCIEVYGKALTTTVCGKCGKDRPLKRFPDMNPAKGPCSLCEPSVIRNIKEAVKTKSGMTTLTDLLGQLGVKDSTRNRHMLSKYLRESDYKKYGRGWKITIATPN